MEKINLQPLRVSAGWNVEWNIFYEVNPSKKNMEYFAENLLYITSNQKKRAIELQWKPEDNPDGEYVLKVINLEEEFNSSTNNFSLSGDWGNPHLIFRSKNRIEIVSKLENLMFFLPTFIDKRIFKSRGIVDEKSNNLRLEFIQNGYSLNIAKKLLESNNAELQNLLLDTKKVSKEIVLFLAKNGVKKSIKNKAKQLLNSKKINV